MNELRDLLKRVVDAERRMSGMVRSGTVHEVDAENGTIRLMLGGTDDKPFLSPAVPYAQIGGALKLHSPPSVGQQMTIVGTGGDWRQSIAIPMTWSDSNPSPGSKGDEHVLTFGPWTISLNGDALTIKGPKLVIDCGGSTFELTGGGLKMVAPDYEFE